jgi:hypothetical protein
MADTAAHSVAAAIGWSVVRRFVPVLDGVLLTGGDPRHLRGRSAGGSPSEMLTLKRSDRTPKIAARYLAPQLAALTPVTFGQGQPAVPVAPPS